MQKVMRLVSCPFCSGEVFLQEGKNKVNSTTYWVECLECGIKSPDDFDAKRVYKYWNKPAFRQLDMLKLESDIFKAEKNGIIIGLKDKIREMGKDNLVLENEISMRATFEENITELRSELEGKAYYEHSHSHIGACDCCYCKTINLIDSIIEAF